MNRRGQLSYEKDLRAADAMQSDLVVIPAWAPVASLVPGTRAGAVYPVLDARGALVGTLDLAELATRPELHDRLAGEVCAPVDVRSVLGPDDRVVANRLPGVVLDQGRLVGVVPGRSTRVAQPLQRKAS